MPRIAFLNLSCCQSLRDQVEKYCYLLNFLLRKKIYIICFEFVLHCFESSFMPILSKVMMKMKCLCFVFISPGIEIYIFVCPVHFHSNIKLFSQQTFSVKRRKEQMTELNQNLSVRESIWNFKDPKCFLPNGLQLLLRTVINNFKIFQCDRMELQIRSWWNYSSLA